VGAQRRGGKRRAGAEAMRCDATRVRWRQGAHLGEEVLVEAINFVGGARDGLSRRLVEARDDSLCQAEAVDRCLDGRGRQTDGRHLALESVAAGSGLVRVGNATWLRRVERHELAALVQIGHAPAQGGGAAAHTLFASGEPAWARCAGGQPVPGRGWVSRAHHAFECSREAVGGRGSARGSHPRAYAQRMHVRSEATGSPWPAAA
jgi:hypothetical protein